MKKITIILLTSACVLTITNNTFGMDPNAETHTKKSLKTDKQIQLLQMNNELLHDNNLLLRTLILQGSIQHTGYISTKDNRTISLYKETNIQLKDQSLCLPTKYFEG